MIATILETTIVRLAGHTPRCPAACVAARSRGIASMDYLNTAVVYGSPCGGLAGDSLIA